MNMCIFPEIGKMPIVLQEHDDDCDNDNYHLKEKHHLYPPFHKIIFFIKILYSAKQKLIQKTELFSWAAINIVGCFIAACAENSNGKNARRGNKHPRAPRRRVSPRRRRGSCCFLTAAGFVRPLKRPKGRTDLNQEAKDTK